jgi:uncharacterized protein VirK/YbjX
MFDATRNVARRGDDRSDGLAMKTVLRAWAGGLAADLGRYRALTVAFRSLRRARILGQGAGLAALADLSGYRAHAAAEGDGDPLFFLSHRHYLLKGLDRRARTEAALCHYTHEAQAFSCSYSDKVYRRGGLVLWQAEASGHSYDIVLQPGRDVAYEGGLSLALRIDGGCVSVLSFSWVPGRILGPELPARVYLISRRHQARDHGYQADYNRAFHRVIPSHMVFAAFSGLALAQGQQTAAGIAPDRHPSDAPELAPYFRASYHDFWKSLGAQPLAGGHYRIGLPMTLSPLDGLEPARRKRALARRAVLEEVRASALQVIAAHLRPEGGQSA